MSDAECGGDKLVTTLTISGPEPVSVQSSAETYTVCEDESKALFSNKVDMVEGGPCSTVDSEPRESESLLFVNCHPRQAYLCPQ